MSSASEFVFQKLVAAALSVAFASSIAQVEAFSGECGLNPAAHHPLFVGLLVAGLGISLAVLSNVEMRVPVEFLLAGISIGYVLIAGAVYGADLLAADRILVEVGVLALVARVHPFAYRVLAARMLISCAIAKVLSCGSVWLSFSAVKTDALNQPFPFTPVWHLAQLPDNITSILSMIILVAEILLPALLVLSRSTGPLFCALGLTAYYAVIGNFNWTILILVATLVRLIPSNIVTLVLSGTTLRRWGWKSDTQFMEKEAESAFVAGLGQAALVSFTICTLVAGIALGLQGTLFGAPLHNVLVGLSASIVGYSVWRLRRNPKVLLVVGLGMWFSGKSMLSLLSVGHIAHVDDFSGLPGCFTFTTGSMGKAAHTKDGRAGFLLQTRFSQMGTNTVGSDLGGTRYAELAVPGSVHGDEVRPAFLLGHLPRLALKLWRIGTGREYDVREGLLVLRRLERAIEEGSEALHVLFNDEFTTSALVGKKNQVQAFYQMYQVTHRMADHLWWKRNYDQVAALPTKEIAVVAPIAQKCAWMVPPRIMGVGTDLILTTMILLVVVGKLLFTSERPKKNKKL